MKQALFSVTDKTGLAFFAKELLSLFPNLQIIASGGTASYLQKEQIPFKPIAHITKFPECFGGRVKTLHPKILGAILYRRGMDEEEAQQLEIEPIDLVVCNLYLLDPRKTGEDLADSMDIGGSSLLRACVKNFTHVAIVSDPQDYSPLIEEWKKEKTLPYETRFRLAAKALRLSASYENTLAEAFSAQSAPAFPLDKAQKLSYGENPDQEGWLYSFAQENGIASAPVFGKKAMSYNNYEDASCAFYALQRVLSSACSHAVAIIKHGGPCGLATGKTLTEAFTRAWDGDPKSAYGSVIAVSTAIDLDFCAHLQNRFIEIVLAPSFSEEFLSWAFDEKPSLRLLQVNYSVKSPFLYRGISGGVLIQTQKQPISVAHLLEPAGHNKAGVVTKRLFKAEKAGLLHFAIACAQSIKSNAIALVRAYSPSCYQIIGLGGGQPNRIDSLERLALPRAKELLLKEAPDTPLNMLLQDVILVSDGFFPFPDTIEEAAKAGIQTFIQPGGSIRDHQVIEAADQNDLCMIFTQERYFSH